MHDTGHGAETLSTLPAPRYINATARDPVDNIDEVMALLKLVNDRNDDVMLKLKRACVRHSRSVNLLKLR